MSESNTEWGHYAENTGAVDRAPLFHEWSQYNEFNIGDNVPGMGDFLRAKGLTWEAVRRTGARWGVENGRPVLVYLFPDAVKYRTLTDPTKRWTSPSGTTWRSMKIIHPEEGEPDGIIIVEGESDGAQATLLFPTWAVGVLPAGALTYTSHMDDQASAFEHVLVGLDNDAAGDEGSARIIERRANARRLRPPGGAKDWCEAAVQGTVAPGWDPLAASEEPPRLPVFSLREVSEADLGTYEENNWFEQDILPKTGSCIIHAPQKSLKSVIMLDMIRALATGTPFAAERVYNGFTRKHDVFGGYRFIAAEPAKVLLFQMEIRPEGFQRRVQGWVNQQSQPDIDSYLDNVFVYNIVDGTLPRLKIGSDTFRSTVLRAIEASGANVVAFDPLQRLTGGADLNAANELENLLDFFADLQNEKITVLSCHHNNKASGLSAKYAGAMTGSQRFAADADSICSVYWTEECGQDDNADRRKCRNFTWTLRNGAATGRSIVVVPAEDDAYMHVTFGDLKTAESEAIEAGAPPLM